MTQPQDRQSGEDFDADAEDAKLLARWSAGPGRRPTPEEAARWAQEARDGKWPRRVRQVGQQQP